MIRRPPKSTLFPDTTLSRTRSLSALKNILSDGTRMAFITAGMGGGTGTGAAPVIARVSKELGILTVGIVTIPFRFEGERKIDQALDGVEEMSKHVDEIGKSTRLNSIHANRSNTGL